MQSFDNFEELYFDEASDDSDINSTEILSTEDIYQLMTEKIQIIREVTEISDQKIRKLLNSFQWDIDKFLEKFYENDAQISTLVKDDFEKVLIGIDQDLMCGICFESSANLSQIEIFQCNHRFCLQCVCNFLNSIILEGGLLRNFIRCPGFKCKYELSDEYVLRYINSEMKVKYKQIITNVFVQQNKMIKWCPNANCQYAVKVNCNSHLHKMMESVRCKCSFWFCFQCEDESHDPISCGLLEEWRKKLKVEEVKSLEWITINTKKCPRCFVSIEKNGGCNHIHCRNCQHDYCWICSGNWRNHNNCSLQSPQNNVTFPDFADTKRLIRYSNTYNLLQNAYKLDVQTYKNYLVFGKEIELENQWVKIDFVVEAVDILLQCRRTLMHLNIFTYFMSTAGNQIYLLDDLGKNLLNVTEDLSFTLENNVSQDNVYSMISNILTKTLTCKSIRGRLLDLIQKGHEKNWWIRWPIPVTTLLGSAQPLSFL